MAIILKNFKFAEPTSIYPWDQWLDGQTWELIQGKDFKCAAKSFRKQAVKAAQKKQGKVRTNTFEKKIVIQFYHKTPR